MLSLELLILPLLFGRSFSRVQHSPEDTYAFPKYRLNFLNNHPVSELEAQQWLIHGLHNGVQDFMGSYHSQYDHDWPQLESDQHPPKLKKIKMGPSRSFMCLIPPGVNDAPREYEEPAAVDPVKSWQLLEPLTGHCLYHRQGWFTYAYCHNSHVRQFRERAHNHPHPPGGRIPQEDTEYQGYTLGKSPSSLRSPPPPPPPAPTEAHAADTQQVAFPEDSHATAKSSNDLQLSEGAGQRYLTSKWTDGTVCDKTLHRREVEIQFHCSMTTTDQIQFLKETSVCKYLLVIGTPRLCGEPGFQSLREKQPAAPIHCREILAPEDLSRALEFQSTLPEAPFPYNSFSRNPVHLPNPMAQQVKKARHKAAGLDRPPALKADDPIYKAIQALLGKDVKIKNAVDKTAQDILDQIDGDLAAGQGGGDGNRLGIPIHDENGEEMFVQVIDLDVEPREGENTAELLARVREALAGQNFVDTSSKKQRNDEEKHDEEEVLYDDDYL